MFPNRLHAALKLSSLCNSAGFPYVPWSISQRDVALAGNSSQGGLGELLSREPSWIPNLYL